MTRLQGRIGPSRAQHSSARAKFRKHKVIMESVTQQRKKLRSIISFEANAPPGYTFIPAGNPQFTVACKELCREQGLKVFTVTTTPHQNTHGLSQQVHRVGYHFPSTVVAKKCMELGLYLSENGNVMSFENFGTKLTRTEGDAEVSQITINTEARDVIRDLFPNIPDEDINQIIKTAFQKGQRKVGTAIELPLARRAQLAVVAHIRHVYTDYDKLLKKTSFQDARRQVEDSTLERLVQWRGDDESGMPELEDVFREVIVISDDEDEEEEVEDSDIAHNKKVPSGDRDLSVEILSTQVVTDKLDVTANDNSNHTVSPFPLRVSRESLSSEYDFMAGTRSKPKVDRRGFSRYQAWDRAMSRYREKKLLPYSKEGSSMPLHNRVSQAPGRPLTPIIERIFDSPFQATYDVRPHSSDRFRAPGLQDNNGIQPTLLPSSKAPDILHFPDGSVFSKIPPVASNKRTSRPIPEAPTKSRRPLDDLSRGIDLIDLTEDTPEFPKRRRLETREFSRDFHRPSSYKDDFPYSHTGYPVPQRAPVVMHNRYFEPMPDAIRVNRMPPRRNDAAPFVINASREETNHPLYHTKDILRDSSGPAPAIPTMHLELPEAHNGTGFSSLGRPRIDRLSQHRDPGFKADGYETDTPRGTLFRDDRPASSHHSRGSGSDDAVWRNKANSYRSQRRLLETQDPSWLAGAPKPSFHGSRVQRAERVSHSPAFAQDDIVELSPSFNADARAENAPQHYGIQNRRVSSQPPLSDTQRKRDTLPASAMRRYEVQLERSMNPRRYDRTPHQER